MKGRLEKIWSLREKGSFVGLYLRIREAEYLCRQRRIIRKTETEGGGNH